MFIMMQKIESGEGGGHWFLFLEVCMVLNLEKLKDILFCEVQMLSESISA